MDDQALVPLAIIDHLPKKPAFPPQTTRQWFRPNPAPAGEVDWSIRNSINYAESGVLAALEQASKFPEMIVENFARKSANSSAAGASQSPHAFVIPAGQRDQTAVDRVVNLLRRQAIEVHVADGAEIKVKEGTFPVGINALLFHNDLPAPAKSATSTQQ